MKMSMIIEGMNGDEVELLRQAKRAEEITTLYLQPSKTDHALIDAVIEVRGGYKGADIGVLQLLCQKPAAFSF